MVYSEETPTLTFTYTAMHGVGYPFILEACRTVGHLKVIPVKEQVMYNIIKTISTTETGIAIYSVWSIFINVKPMM